MTGVHVCFSLDPKAVQGAPDDSDACLSSP